MGSVGIKAHGDKGANEVARGLSTNQSNGCSCPFLHMVSAPAFLGKDTGSRSGLQGGGAAHTPSTSIRGCGKQNPQKKKKNQNQNKTLYLPCKLYRQKQELEADQFLLDSGV